jgi:hypothetical protein
MRHRLRIALGMTLMVRRRLRITLGMTMMVPMIPRPQSVDPSLKQNPGDDTT